MMQVNNFLKFFAICKTEPHQTWRKIYPPNQPVDLIKLLKVDMNQNMIFVFDFLYPVTILSANVIFFVDKRERERDRQVLKYWPMVDTVRSCGTFSQPLNFYYSWTIVSWLHKQEIVLSKLQRNFYDCKRCLKLLHQLHI